ncbi:MAG: glycosyltransferase family 9 protein [Candidatus Thermochlorobacter sp.]
MLEVPIFTRRNHPAFNPELSFLDYQRYSVWSVAEWQPVSHKEGTKSELTFSDQVRQLFFATLASINGRRHYEPSAAKIDGRALQRILLFRYDAIGDYICTTPVIRWLKTAQPNLQIDVVSSYRNDTLVRADFNVAHAYPIHPRAGIHSSWIPLLRATRTANYDAIFALVYTRTSKAALLASLISSKAKKIAVQHDKRSEIYRLVFDYQVPLATYGEHYSRTMLRMATHSIDFPDAAPPNNLPTYLSVHASSVEPVLQLVQQYDLDFSVTSEHLFVDGKPATVLLPSFSGRPYCIVNIAASRLKPDCLWSAERVTEVCKMLVKSYADLMVFVTGALSEREQVQTIVKMVSDARCQPLMIGLLEICVAIAGAKFVLTPDTAIVHIASAAGVPVVGLYSQLRSIAEWYPYQSPFALLLSPNEGSINHIPLARVEEALEQLFSETKISL